MAASEIPRISALFVGTLELGRFSGRRYSLSSAIDGHQQSVRAECRSRAFRKHSATLEGLLLRTLGPGSLLDQSPRRRNVNKVPRCWRVSRGYSTPECIPGGRHEFRQSVSGRLSRSGDGRVAGSSRSSRHFRGTVAALLNSRRNVSLVDRQHAGIAAGVEFRDEVRHSGCAGGPVDLHGEPHSSGRRRAGNHWGHFELRIR